MVRTLLAALLIAATATPAAADSGKRPDYICGGTTRPCPSPGFIDDGSRDAVRPGNIRRTIQEDRRNALTGNRPARKCGPKPANQGPDSVRNEPGC